MQSPAAKDELTFAAEAVRLRHDRVLVVGSD
jgi:hypothetical protein